MDSRDNKVKVFLLQQKAETKANRAIDHLLVQFKCTKVSDILPVIKLRFPSLVPTAQKRIEKESADDRRPTDPPLAKPNGIHQ